MVEEPKNCRQMDWAFPLVSEWYGGAHGVGCKMHLRLKSIRQLDSLSTCVGSVPFLTMSFARCDVRAWLRKRTRWVNMSFMSALDRCRWWCSSG